MTTPAGRVLGIDVSHHQGAIDWKKVAAAGVKFAYLKATESNKFVDDRYAANRAAAKKAGILTGAYHFHHYDVDWSEQAHLFVTTVGSFKGDLPPALDLEQDDFRNGKTGVAKETAARQTLAWLDAVGKAAGSTPVVYCDPDFRGRFLTDADYGKSLLWEASLTKSPPSSIAPWKHLSFWQYDWKGHVPGISGNVDMDYFMGTSAELFSLIAK